ncbi:MAG: hypothetical protein ABI651_05330 [Verrucomicrobiota bacterium]
MKKLPSTIKDPAIPRARIISYRFSAFARAIDDLPVSQIKTTAEDYHECIAWDLSRGNVKSNRNIENILAFWRFLNSNRLPPGLSRFERRFYLRTMGRMVRHSFLPAMVLDQFKSGGSKKSAQPKNSSSRHRQGDLANPP